MRELYTPRGSKISRYKNNVGKHIGGKVYAHCDYINDIVPHHILNMAVSCLPGLVKFNTFVYDLKDKSVRFDVAADFDTAREPCAGDYVRVRVNGYLDIGSIVSIWHHKWLWVKDDYKGFNVEESYNWSRTWLDKLKKPASGSPQVWGQQLKEVGLE